jgi:hypothetical protein
MAHGDPPDLPDNNEIVLDGDALNEPMSLEELAELATDDDGQQLLRTLIADNLADSD